MELFNSGTDKHSIGFNEGGLPFYNTDVSLLQDNAFLFGLPSLFKGYNIVLNGCLVDDLNLLDKTIKLTKGTVLIDNLIFEVGEYTGNYPVCLKLNDPIVKQRKFKSGDNNDSTISYSVSYTTNITTTKSIVYDPFTAQRVENYNNSLGKLNGEIKEFIWSTTLRRKTDTGKTIKNGTVNLIDNTGKGLFNLAGWEIVNDGRVTVSNNSKYNLGQVFGTETFTLDTKNIPEHQHGKGTLTVPNGGSHNHLAGGLTTKTNGSHNHLEGGYSEYGVGTNRSQGYQWRPVSTKEDERSRRFYTSTDGSHSHTITGSTESASHSHTITGQTGDIVNGQDVPDSIQNMQPSITVLRMQYVGLEGLTNHTGTHL